MSQPFGVPPSGIQLGAGISVGSGINLGARPSLTISSSDFNNGNYSGGNIAYVTPGGGNLYCPVYALVNPNGSIGTTITNFFAACGYDINTSYVFNATFASATINGTTTNNYSCLVRLSYSTGGGEIDMTTIDQSNPGWQSGNPSSGSVLQGTFTLPFTLTPYSPTVSMGGINWC